jgi:hypothetical protein
MVLASPVTGHSDVPLLERIEAEEDTRKFGST